MQPDLLDLYRQASTWTIERVAGATTQLAAPTPCDEWDVRTLLNHMLETQRFFTAQAKGEDAALPGPMPPDVLSDDPVADFEHGRTELLDAYGRPGVLEKAAPALSIAFSDQLIHGWDLAQATGQDAVMPPGLAEASYEMIHGRLTDEQRQAVFKPAVPVAADASPQETLLAYTGRPSR